MKEIKLRTRTQYFAIKNSIFQAIRYFSEKKSDNFCVVKSEFEGGDLQIEFSRDVIKEFLGYDFRQKKLRCKRETLPNGKLFNKIQILTLYSKCIKVLTDDEEA